MAKETAEEREMNQLMKVRREKMAALEEKGISPFGEKFVPTHHIAEIIANKDELIASGTEVSIAGRLMAKRGQGKAGFGNVEDITGNIQIYSRLDVAGEDSHWLFKKADIGDLVGIKGKVFVTERGELSVSVLCAFEQIPASIAGEIPRLDRRRGALSSKICRFNYE